MTAYDTILAALDAAGMKVKPGRDSARAQCPTHHSTALTLSVRCGTKRAWIYCFAGCRDAEVLADLDLEVRDLFDHDRAPGYVSPPRRELAPWEAAMAELGIHHPPPIEHVLERMAYDQGPGHHDAAFDERRNLAIVEARQAHAGDRAAGAVTLW